MCFHFQETSLQKWHYGYICYSRNELEYRIVIFFNGVKQFNVPTCNQNLFAEKHKTFKEKVIFNNDIGKPQKKFSFFNGRAKKALPPPPLWRAVRFILFVKKSYVSLNGRPFNTPPPSSWHGH